MKKRKWLRKTLWTVLILFALMNIVAFFHAYKFTHFSNTKQAKTKAADLTFGGKIEALLFGISNPRPANLQKPSHNFETITLQSNKKIEGWLMKADSSKGTVILFHGYGGEKSSLLDKADEFLKMGYSTMLVDFMGSGGSEGNQTTIGYKEAEQVKTSYDYISSQGEKNIYLFGTSLGAAAILKCIHDYSLTPSGIIIECPFGTMYKTTCNRFRNMGVPSFPMAGLLVFWGGVQNGFWAFSNNPEAYAKSVKCPTLLLYGEKDLNVTRGETDAIYKNLSGDKKLRLFPEAGHENYITRYKDKWLESVKPFLLRGNQ